MKNGEKSCKVPRLMSVTIRLTRIGKKNAPSFRVVAMPTRSKRDGRSLEIMGYFDPSHNPTKIEIKKDRIAYWKGQGALISSAVQKLIDGEYEYVKYEPKKKKEAEEEVTEEEKTEESGRQ